MKNKIILNLILFCAVVSVSVAAVCILDKSGKSAPASAGGEIESSSVSETYMSAGTTPATTVIPVTTVTAIEETTAAPQTAGATTKATAKATTTVKTAASSAVPKTEPPAISFSHPELAGCSQILLVTVADSGTSYADIAYYEKNGDAWKEIFKTTGRVGSKGIIPEADRLQDTYKTPAGILKIIGAFGKAPDPGTAFDYIKVTQSMFWDLNSGSPNYNRLVTSDPGGKCEHLIDYDTYRYSLITDYNYGQTAGKGGAIFIHCNGAGATAGCVSMPENYMKTLIMSVDPAKNPAAVITLKSELSKYTG
jgi:L,D-peptidoglycan transpeptidase YkuD (ErfK/YbiS/YcfS/YnhG family)